MGHFLAQGQNVLVTSHTPKALSVLKEKVPQGLRNLCVSVLEDSNVDMERSVDGIAQYMSRTTSFELKREMDVLGQDREAIIEQLAQVRKRIYRLIHQECSSISWQGEEIAPSAAARFVLENQDRLSYIPGKVDEKQPLPLTRAELAELYRSNEELCDLDERDWPWSFRTGRNCSPRWNWKTCWRDWIPRSVSSRTCTAVKAGPSGMTARKIASPCKTAERPSTWCHRTERLCGSSVTSARPLRMYSPG